MKTCRMCCRFEHRDGAQRPWGFCNLRLPVWAANMFGDGNYRLSSECHESDERAGECVLFVESTATPEPVDYLNELGTRVHDMFKEGGWTTLRPEDWKDDHKVPAKLALIHSEVSRALEAFRLDSSGRCAEEIADIVIRALDLAKGLGRDIDHDVESRIEHWRLRGFKYDQRI